MLQKTPPASNETKLRNLEPGDKVIYAQSSFPFLGNSLYGLKGVLHSISKGPPKTAQVLFHGDPFYTEVEYEAL